MKRFSAFLRKNWLVVLGTVLSAATILTFFLLTDGISVLQQVYRSLRYPWLLLAGGLVVAQWLFDAAGLHALLRLYDRRHRFSQSVVTTMMGVLYSAITPSSTGGQPMQIVSLTRQGLDTPTATSTIIVKTVLYQVAITLCALAMVVLELPFFQAHVSEFSFVVVFAMALSLFFIGSLLLFMINQSLTRRIGHGLVRLLKKLKFCRDEQRLHEKLDIHFEQFFVSVGILGSAWRRCLGVMVLTVLQLLCYFAVPYCLYRSFGLAGDTVLRLVAAATFVYFASMFVPVPGASGGAEGSFYLFFSPFFPAGMVAPAILLWRLMTYYASIVVGFLFSLAERKSSAAATPETKDT